jgi:hypothetical protein
VVEPADVGACAWQRRVHPHAFIDIVALSTCGVRRNEVIRLIGLFASPWAVGPFPHFG